jgi:hypothetical protein
MKRDWLMWTMEPQGASGLPSWCQLMGVGGGINAKQPHKQRQAIRKYNGSVALHAIASA